MPVCMCVFVCVCMWCVMCVWFGYYVCVSSRILTVVTREKNYVEIFCFLSCDTSQDLLITVEATQKIRGNFQGALNPLSANPTKLSNTLKQFVGKLPTNCLSVFDHFVGLALKGLKPFEVSNKIIEDIFS